MSPRKPSRNLGKTKNAALQPPISLKALAEHLELSPATVSLVINRAPGAKAISDATKSRILAAARKFNYRANFFARSLRTLHSYTIGVLVPEISEGYAAMVLSGIEDRLLESGYFYFVASHRHREDLLREYPQLFLDRAIEGLIAVDTPITKPIGVPIVAVSGHTDAPEICNIVLNHSMGAKLVLEHLYEFGHREIAFIKGQAFSSDTAIRWNALREQAQRMGLAVDKDLVVQLEGISPSPDPGYQATRRLLKMGKRFTALVAFNDMSAIGAMQALREAGLKVPGDVSVVGFDDIQAAAFQHPPLTTVRQPLRKMGETAAETVVARIADPEMHKKRIIVEPELVVRESTAPVRAIASHVAAT